MSPADMVVRLFKEQLDNECRKLAETKGLTIHGHSLIWWYFQRIHGLSDDAIREAFCDGYCDLAIDAIWIDDDDIVHFYQFYHPQRAESGVDTGSVDKVLGGLRLIIGNHHSEIANEAIRSRVEHLHQKVRRGYRLHIVSSGAGIHEDGAVRIRAFAESVWGSSTLFDWYDEHLSALCKRYHKLTQPAISAPIRFAVPKPPPYMAKEGGAECYLFHGNARFLADLYETFQEELLQRNIRVDQGNTATNRSIEESCTGDDSANFFHYNNGITFLCDTAGWDPMANTLTLERAQVVNGGQTIRVLHRAHRKMALHENVTVVVRVITSNGNREFANDVAVNQNNQNQMKPGFLRSNDPLVIQLDKSLASRGWYLERREKELGSATSEERAAIETRIGCPLDGRVIQLKEGAQAYVATFYGEPELAKKNAKKIFLSTNDGGSFETIFSKNLTAEKFVTSHLVSMHVDSFVRRFNVAKKRRNTYSEDRPYRELLGSTLCGQFPEYLDQAIPQSAIFLCGTLFFDWVTLQKKDPHELPKALEENSDGMIQEHLAFIFGYAKGHPAELKKSWPTLLKSKDFFKSVTLFIGKQRK